MPTRIPGKKNVWADELSRDNLTRFAHRRQERLRFSPASLARSGKCLTRLFTRLTHAGVKNISPLRIIEKAAASALVPGTLPSQSEEGAPRKRRTSGMLAALKRGTAAGRALTLRTEASEPSRATSRASQKRCVFRLASRSRVRLGAVPLHGTLKVVLSVDCVGESHNPTPQHVALT